MRFHRTRTLDESSIEECPLKIVAGFLLLILPLSVRLMDVSPIPFPLFMMRFVL
jgi:hypothetical protein